MGKSMIFSLPRRIILDLHKAAAARVGEVRSRKDGDWKKISPSKWIRVENKDTESFRKESAMTRIRVHFHLALQSPLKSDFIAAMVQNGVKSESDLIEKVKTGSGNLAGDIFRTMIYNLRKKDAPKGQKKYLTHHVARALLTLKEYFSQSGKTLLTVQRTTKEGKTYRMSESQFKVSSKLPTLPPVVLSSARKKLGGWDVSEGLTNGNIKKMLSNRTAILKEGRIDPKRDWIMPRKAVDMGFKYDGNHLLLKVKQIRPMKKGDKRTRATAKVEIKLPYAYAKAFLINQISSVRTRNNFIFRLERSKGYRRFLQEASDAS